MVVVPVEMFDEVDDADGELDDEEEFFGDVNSDRISGLLFVPGHPMNVGDSFNPVAVDPVVLICCG